MNDTYAVEQAVRLHREALVMDMTMPMIPGGKISRFFSALDAMQANGVDFVSLTLASDFTPTSQALRNITLIRLVLLLKARRVRLVKTVAEIRRAAAEGKLAVGLHFQGTAPLGEDLTLVSKLYKKGIRHLLMAYNSKNLVGYGCHEPDDQGLTPFGRDLIREMNRVGMLVDVAHTGYRTAMETIEASSAPVVVSHCNVWELVQHPRCVRDDTIRAIAAQKGMLGVTGYGVFLGDNNVSTERYVQHLDHIAQLVGPEYVGIGLDYVYDMETFINFARSQPDKYPEEGGYLGNVQQVEYSQFPAITEALLKRGYSEEAVRGILGENWLRVLGQVWK